MNSFKDRLATRARIFAEIRAFFDERGFVEVDTPVLASGVASEANIRHCSTRMQWNGDHATYYLLASPETYMKRLLVEGMDKIYQISRCFRSGESGPMHNPEFCMLEWYRCGADYRQIMDDTEALVRHVAGKITVKPLGNGTWQRMTVAEAFTDFADLDLGDDSAGGLRLQARARGISSVLPDDTWEDTFYKVLIEKIEPALKQLGSVFLLDFPAKLASLARLKRADPRVAERVELYIDGIELANGFSELTDAVQQRQRFAEECRNMAEQGEVVPRQDEKFLAALEKGMPPAGGMALGVDRLAMLLMGATSIDQVLAFPIQQA
jgi:elongation factor P--(R)-beta-lysine ligase